MIEFKAQMRQDGGLIIESPGTKKMRFILPNNDGMAFIDVFRELKEGDEIMLVVNNKSLEDKKYGE
jgi:hypothetical protein